MVEIPVRKKTVVPWWAWLIGLLVIVAVLWFLFAPGSREPVAAAKAAEAVTSPGTAVANPSVEPASAEVATATKATSGASAAEAISAPAPPVAVAVIDDAGLYAATSDKLSLVGRAVELRAVKVVRIVGPKTFTVASGSGELFVMVDPHDATGVGSQGRVKIGDSLSVEGTFQRLQQAEIDDIASNRFRGLTPLERETLAKTKVYLQATKVG